MDNSLIIHSYDIGYIRKIARSYPYEINPGERLRHIYVICRAIMDILPVFIYILIKKLSLFIFFYIFASILKNTDDNSLYLFI